MLSNLTVAFLASLGFGAWIFSKVQRQTGGNTSNSLVVAGGSGVLLFLLVVTALSFL